METKKRNFTTCKPLKLAKIDIKCREYGEQPSPERSETFFIQKTLERHEKAIFIKVLKPILLRHNIYKSDFERISRKMVEGSKTKYFVYYEALFGQKTSFGVGGKFCFGMIEFISHERENTLELVFTPINEIE